jgi:hypothetical protein
MSGATLDGHLLIVQSSPMSVVKICNFLYKTSIYSTPPGENVSIKGKNSLRILVEKSLLRCSYIDVVFGRQSDHFYELLHLVCCCTVISGFTANSGSMPSFNRGLMAQLRELCPSTIISPVFQGGDLVEITIQDCLRKYFQRRFENANLSQVTFHREL